MSDHGIHLGRTAHAGDAVGFLARVGEQIGLAATLGYILLSVVGVFFEFLLLKLFGTPYLTYAEPTDFLMAGMRHPVVLGFFLLSVALLLLIIGARNWARRTFPRYAVWHARYDTLAWRRPGRVIMYPLFIAVYFYVFTIGYARREAMAAVEGEMRPVELSYLESPGSTSVYSLKGQLIVTTGRFLFLYSAQDSSVHVVPVTAVREVRAAYVTFPRRSR